MRSRELRAFFGVLFALLVTLPASMSGQSVRQVGRSQSGMVSAAHPLATDAGVRMLELGGNAAGAAVAAGVAAGETAGPGAGVDAQPAVSSTATVSGVQAASCLIGGEANAAHGPGIVARCKSLRAAVTHLRRTAPGRHRPRPTGRRSCSWLVGST